MPLRVSVFTLSLSPEGTSCFLFLLPVAWITRAATPSEESRLLWLLKQFFLPVVVLYSSFPSASL